MKKFFRCADAVFFLSLRLGPCSYWYKDGGWISQYSKLAPTPLTLETFSEILEKYPLWTFALYVQNDFRLVSLDAWLNKS